MAFEKLRTIVITGLSNISELRRKAHKPAFR
jgi:hypothetical protein